MPQAALLLGPVDAVLPVDRIAALFESLAPPAVS
jgi:hypothetical protein